MHHSQHLIYETYLDSFGHLNHAKYLELYEQARWNWMADAGLSLADIARSGVGPVILNINVSYRRELKARDQITILTSIQESRGKIFTIEQAMYLSNELSEDAAADKPHPASEAKITAGMMDMKQRKLIEPPAIWRDAFALTD